MHAEVVHALHGSDRRRCMQRGEDQMAAIGGEHRRGRRFGIANFADHDDVRRLPQHAAQ